MEKTNGNTSVNYLCVHLVDGMRHEYPVFACQSVTYARGLAVEKFPQMKVEEVLPVSSERMSFFFNNL